MAVNFAFKSLHSLELGLCCRRDAGSTFYPPIHAFEAALGNLRRFQEAVRAGWSCWSWCGWRAIEDRRVGGFGAATAGPGNSDATGCEGGEVALDLLNIISHLYT